MKKIIPFILVLFIFFLLCLSSIQLFSQVSVVSTKGYAVNINVTPVSIVPTSNTCTWGYNYNVTLRYNITITGPNAPASLYTLQGTLGCSSANHFFDLPNNGGSGTVTSQSNQWTSAKDCSTATVISKNCNTVNIEISGPGISSRTVSFAVSASVLSIKLLSFTAEQEKNKVKLNWATATETDNDYFTIERSTDGAQWSEVKRIKGAGNSTSLIAYESYDESPVAGTSYYRLKQTDFDGQATYSEIQTVKYLALTKGVGLYPVPNTGNTITLTGISDYKNHELSVVNASGSVLFSTTLNRASVELPSLQPGMYVVRVKDKVAGTVENLRYVKM